jgi:hypothetical protein
MHVKKIFGQYEPNVGLHRLAGTPHLADDFPTAVTDTTAECPGSL